MQGPRALCTVRARRPVAGRFGKKCLADTGGMEPGDGEPLLGGHGLKRCSMRRSMRQVLGGLHEVFAGRDPARNVLFNHLGMGEDERGLVI